MSCEAATQGSEQNTDDKPPWAVFIATYKAADGIAHFRSEPLQPGPREMKSVTKHDLCLALCFISVEACV